MKKLLAKLWWPSFRVCYAISAGTLALLFLWAVLDLTFFLVTYILSVDLHICPNFGFASSYVHSWNVFGPRIFLQGAMWFIAALATLGVFSRLFVGRGSGRSIAAAMWATALLALWLTFYLQFDSLSQLSFRWWIHRKLPQFHEMAVRLSEDWPQTTTEVPKVGTFRVYSDGPNVLIAPKNRDLFPFCDFTDILVLRTKSGAIVTEILSIAMELEFHPSHTVPESFSYITPSGVERRYQLLTSEALGNDQYFTSYNWGVDSHPLNQSSTVAPPQAPAPAINTAPASNEPSP